MTGRQPGHIRKAGTSRNGCPCPLSPPSPKRQWQCKELSRGRQGSTAQGQRGVVLDAPSVSKSFCTRRPLGKNSGGAHGYEHCALCSVH